MIGMPHNLAVFEKKFISKRFSEIICPATMNTNSLEHGPHKVQTILANRVAGEWGYLVCNTNGRIQSLANRIDHLGIFIGLILFRRRNCEDFL